MEGQLPEVENPRPLTPLQAEAGLSFAEMRGEEKLFIHLVEGNPATGKTEVGRLIATVTEEGEVEPEHPGIREHVERVRAEGLRGQALRDRLQRSYTNGYIVAEWRRS